MKTATQPAECREDQCGRPVEAKDRCSMHYRQWLKAGAPDFQPDVAVLGRATWVQLAACQDSEPESFFPISEKRGTPETDRALAVCARCPVVQECRDWAFTAMSDGIAGGMTSGERRNLRAAHRRAHSVFAHQLTGGTR